MFRLVVAYEQPEDPEKFLDHYRKVHFPIALEMPDVKAAHWGRVIDPAGGTPDKFVITTMDWADKETATASLGSEVGERGNADLANFAQAGVSVYMLELED